MSKRIFLKQYRSKGKLTIYFKEENRMNKAELVTSMAEESNLTKKDAEAALNAFMKVVQDTLADGEKYN